VRDRFLESILAVIDVANIDFQTGEAPRVIQARKISPGAFRGLKRHVVLTSENHRLDRAAQSYRSFVPIAQRFVKAKRLLMVLDGGAIIARGIQSVGFCSQGKRQSSLPRKRLAIRTAASAK